MSLYESGASLGPHYEDKLRVVLTNVWRHKLLVIVTVAAALVIGIALAIMMPNGYTAEAYLREGFGTEEAILPERQEQHRKDYRLRRCDVGRNASAPAAITNSLRSGSCIDLRCSFRERKSVFIMVAGPVLWRCYNDS